MVFLQSFKFRCEFRWRVFQTLTGSLSSRADLNRDIIKIIKGLLRYLKIIAQKLQGEKTKKGPPLPTFNKRNIHISKNIFPSLNFPLKYKLSLKTNKVNLLHPKIRPFQDKQQTLITQLLITPQ